MPVADAVLAHQVGRAAGEQQLAGGQHAERSPWRIASSTDWVENISARPPPRRLVQPSPQPVALVGAEGRRRLVEQEDLGSPARAIARFRRWRVPVESFAADWSAKRPRSARAIRSSAAASGSSRLLEGGEQAQVLAGREARVERRLLGHPADARGHPVGPGDGALAGAADPREDRQQGGLPGAVRPEQRDRLARPQVEVDAVQGREVAVSPTEAARHKRGGPRVVTAPRARSSSAIVDHPPAPRLRVGQPRRPCSWRVVARLR